MTLRERFRLGLGFLLAWLQTPSSKAGLAAILGAVIGNRLAPNIIEGIVQSVIVGAGVVLVMWPERTK